MLSLERAWAEIDLDNLAYNYRQIARHVAPCQVLCVVKADAYGHGAPQVAKALAGAGAGRFAVATPQEAMQLRRHGITQPILLLGATSGSWAPALAAQNVTLTVAYPEAAREYAKALNGSPAKIHIKIDTGMGRLGLDGQDTEAAARQILDIANTPGFAVEGLFTHFPSADEADADAYTTHQTALFGRLVARLAESGFEAPLLHSANSAGIAMHPASWGNMVRPGLLLYGVQPCGEEPFPVRQVMSLRARISQVRAVRKGEYVSYGRIWQAPRDSVVAVATIGYADGLFRSLSGKIDLLVNGRRAPQIGRICMDMCMLDVTELPDIAVDDAATVFGADAGDFIPADEVAATAGTIPYEVLCAVGRRMPRFYSRDDCFVQEVAYIDEL